MHYSNPFANIRSQQHSNYNGIFNDVLQAVDSSKLNCPRTTYVHDQFRSFVLGEDFSCILGKAAVKKNTYRFGLYRDWNDKDVIYGVAYDLYRFLEDRSSLGGDYTTFIASFALPIANEQQFENEMWSFLEQLSYIDQLHFQHDSTVSSDPANKNYSYSFANNALFVVGLHPQSSRLTRRFAFPTIIFNPHTQFRNLKKNEKFEKYQNIIRKREMKLQGSINPNLANFGEMSEARQYSGKHVEESWVCPHFTRK